VKLALKFEMPYEAARIRWEVAARRGDTAAEAEAALQLAECGVDVNSFAACVGAARRATSLTPSKVTRDEPRGLSPSAASARAPRAVAVWRADGPWRPSAHASHTCLARSAARARASTVCACVRARRS
jgi:hypothetical protein